MSESWHIDIARDSGTWYWRLWNRRGDLVMRSHEKYPTPASAQLAADYEASLLSSLAEPTEDTLAEALKAVGLPEDESIEMLIRHHRNNAAAAAGFDLLTLETWKERALTAEALLASRGVSTETRKAAGSPDPLKGETDVEA